MRDMKRLERTAIDAIARMFAASWEKPSDSTHAFIVVAGKRVSVDITTLKPHGAGRANAAKPRLRFDKVATRLVERLRSVLSETVPDGMTVLLTITAPIRLPSKTAASLEDKIQTLVERRSTGRDAKETIHGNRAQIRLLAGESARAPKMIGFVHNSDSDPVQLLNMTHEMLELFSAQGGRQPTKLPPDRWLVVISARGISCLEAYRYIYSQLRIATDFRKIFLVFNDGRVGLLTG